MLDRFTIYLSRREKVALVALAASDMRDLRDEVRFLLRQALESRGLLQLDERQNLNPDNVGPSQDAAHSVWPRFPASDQHPDEHP